MTAHSNTARARRSRQTMVNAEQILKSFVERIDTPEDDRQFDYRDPTTERLFMVVRSEGFDIDDTIRTRYCLQESAPTGRLVFWNEQGFCTESRDEPRLADAEKRAGPNGFMAEVSKLGIDLDAISYSGTGYSVDTIYLGSMEECADAIERCLRENVRYESRRVLSEREKIKLERRWSASSFAHHRAEAAVVEQTWENEPELFKGCHTGLHEPLSEDTKTEILAYLNVPSHAGWLNIRSLQVLGFTTLWQAWCKLDATAPRVGNDNRFPEADTLRTAIRHAAEAHRAAVIETEKTANPSGLKLV